MRDSIGTALRIARKAQILSPSLLDRLDKFKEERNWLVHRSLYRNGDDLYNDQKRYQVLNRLEAFSKEASCLRRLISDELIEFVERQGVSREWIENHAAHQIKVLSGKDD